MAERGVPDGTLENCYERFARCCSSVLTKVCCDYNKENNNNTLIPATQDIGGAPSMLRTSILPRSILSPMILTPTPGEGDDSYEMPELTRSPSVITPSSHVTPPTINTGRTNIQHFSRTSAPRRVRTRGGSRGGRVFREQSYAAYPNEEHLLFSQQNI